MAGPFYSQGDGNWSTVTNWDTNTGGGGTDPTGADEAGMDDSVFIIQAGHEILMNVDMSAWATGIISLLIKSDASTPGMLYWKDGQNGILKIKSGAVATNKIYGDSTSATCRGRVLANLSGLWTGSTASATLMASQRGVSGAVTDGGGSKRIFTPTVSPAWVVDALIGESMTINGTTYAIEDNDATTATLTTGPAIGATVTAWTLVTRPVPVDHTARIQLGALSTIESRYLDALLFAKHPTSTYVQTYGQVFHECTVSAAADTLTYTGLFAAVPNGTLVRVSAGSGALPAELSANTDYWAVGGTGNTIQLASAYGGSAIGLSAGGPINLHIGWYDTWGISANTLTKTDHRLANNVPVKLKWTGTAPVIDGVDADPDALYWVINTAVATSIQLAMNNNASATAVTITGSPTTLHVYTGSTGAVTSGGIGGTNPYTSIMVNVLDDVTAQAEWVGCGDGSTWSTCTTKSAVLLGNLGLATYDQQRLAVKTITATTMTLSAAVDSIQYPGARVWLTSRNASIWSEATTAIAIIDATNSVGGGVWGCEIRNRIVATVTTFYSNGIVSANACEFSGVLSGLSAGLSTCANPTSTGIIVGCAAGLQTCTNLTIGGTVAHCGNGITACTAGTVSATVIGHDRAFNACITLTVSGITGLSSNFSYVGSDLVISGTIKNCIYALNTASGFLVTGTIIGCTQAIYLGVGVTLGHTGVIKNCAIAISQGVNHVIYGTITGVVTTAVLGIPTLVTTRGASLPTSPSYSGRNIAGAGSRLSQFMILHEDYGGVKDASVAVHPVATVTSQSSIVRSGGAATAMQVLPLSQCQTAGVRGMTNTTQIRVFEWTELDVAASEQTKSVYVRGSNGTAWSVYPTGGADGELFFEAEYFNSASAMTKSVIASTAVLTDNTTWVKFSVTFVPGRIGQVRYRLIFGAYQAATSDIYVDNQLVTG